MFWQQEKKLFLLQILLLGVATRCLEIEGSPYDYNEKRASEMYSIISDYYGTAGKYFVNKVKDEYEEENYKVLKDEYKKILKRIEEETENDILSYVSSVSVVTLADILIGKWLFNEDEEKSFEMAREILKGLDKATDIDIVDKCYEYITSWIKGNHKSFDTYKKNLTPAEKTRAKLNREDDLTETDRTKKSFGIYDNERYYVLRYVLEDKFNILGYSYRKMISEFAKRGYIEPIRDDEGNIISTSVQKKFRGTNTRFFAFPVEMMEEDITEEEREQLGEDLAAQERGFKNEEDFNENVANVLEVD